ncbi:MAG: zinc ribbon domain-containing protein [Gammaproteobacteria bacterium]
MPIYEYECRECGHKLEAIQRFSDAPLKTCPACSKDSLKKLISAAGFHLKGTGWYETDFKNKGKPATKKKEDGEGGDKAGKADEKKPAKTEETTKSSGAAATPD